MFKVNAYWYDTCNDIGKICCTDLQKKYLQQKSLHFMQSKAKTIDTVRIFKFTEQSAICLFINIQFLQEQLIYCFDVDL